MPEEKRFTRREFMIGAGAATLAGAAGVSGFECAPVHGNPETRPNFVFILTDDQRWDAMSCAGHPFLRTPNMDRLAKEGARFTNAFVTIALCAPSRGCFLSGRYAHSHGVMNNGTLWKDETPTMPMALQKAGYDTAFIGKWHMGGQEGPRPGFDHWVSFKGQGPYRHPTLNIDGESRQVNGYITDLLTDYAVEWLEKPRAEPFCLYMCHKAVHGPFSPAFRHSKLYEDVAIPRPESMKDTLEGKPEWVKLGMEPGHDSKGALQSDEGYDDFIRDYNRTLMAVDDSVGRILDALEKQGVLGNTVIVFAGDNGYFQGEHGRLDKRAMYEESIRIPFLMRYPKMIEPGTLIDGMVLNIDLAPTFLDLAGTADLGSAGVLTGNDSRSGDGSAGVLTGMQGRSGDGSAGVLTGIRADGIQGRSIVPLLKGKKSGRREDWLYEYFQEKGFPRTPTMTGVRTDRWKYVEYPEITDKAELYDLKADPMELHNLIDDPKHARTLSDMRARLARLLEETGYPSVPLSRP